MQMGLRDTILLSGALRIAFVSQKTVESASGRNAFASNIIAQVFLKICESCAYIISKKRFVTVSNRRDYWGWRQRKR